MIQKLPGKTVVIVGGGLTAGLAARQLTNRNIDVLVLERGGDHADGAEAKLPTQRDELRWQTRQGLVQDWSVQTYTLRYSSVRGNASKLRACFSRSASSVPCSIASSTRPIISSRSAMFSRLVNRALPFPARSANASERPNSRSAAAWSPLFRYANARAWAPSESTNGGQEVRSKERISSNALRCSSSNRVGCAAT